MLFPVCQSQVLFLPYPVNKRAQNKEQGKQKRVHLAQPQEQDEFCQVKERRGFSMPHLTVQRKTHKFLENLLGLMAQGDNPIRLHVDALAGGSCSPRWGQS